MQLTFVQMNRPYAVKKIRGRDDVKRHLSHLGLVENANVSLCQCDGGNVIVEVKGSRLALNASVASRIEVQEIS